VSHLVTTALSGVWPFVATNVDDLVVLAVLFSSVGRGGPSVRQIVVGQYLGIGALVVVSILVAVGLTAVPDRWIGLLGLVPISLGVRGLMRARRPTEDGGNRSPVAGVTGLLGVVALTVADGGDNVSVYVPLFRQAGAYDTSVWVVVFAVLVGVWCLGAHWLAHRGPWVATVERVGRWLIPTVYVLIGIRIIVASGLLTG
jgi:cadmium resistance transport/sequestration family protein